MPKVLITEVVHSAGPALLREAGFEVVEARADAEIIRREIETADAVLTRIYELSPELLATAKNLKIVSKHGVGYDNIPVDWCKEHGVAVTTAPGANGLSVAEHAFALMVTLAKNIIPVSDAYRKIGFAAKNSKEGIELTGKTVGILGLGGIGRQFAAMCAGAFGMRILAYDPYLKEAPAGVTQMDDLDEMLAQADVISLHGLLTDETRKIINAERIAKMKPGAIFINCARGPMVDEEALIQALESGHLRGAGLDVTDPEPAAPDNPLFALPNAIVTPHYAPATEEAARRVSEISSQNVIAVLTGKEPVGRIA